MIQLKAYPLFKWRATVVVIATQVAMVCAQYNKIDYYNKSGGLAGLAGLIITELY